MAAAVGKGAPNINSVYFKPMLRKAYHKKSASPPETAMAAAAAGDSVELKGSEELKANQNNENNTPNMWVPDNRTGIYYPKGQEKVMEDVSPLAGKDFGINWFSNP